MHLEELRVNVNMKTGYILLIVGKDNGKRLLSRSCRLFYNAD